MPAPRSSPAGMVLLTVGPFATIVGMTPASAAEAPVGLGSAEALLRPRWSTVTDTGSSVVSGNLGGGPAPEGGQIR